MPRKIQVIFGLDPAEYEKLNRESEKEHRSKSEIIRIALKQYLQSAQRCWKKFEIIDSEKDAELYDYTETGSLNSYRIGIRDNEGREFILQKGIDGKHSIPPSGQRYWKKKEDQDYAFKNYDPIEILLSIKLTEERKN